MKRIIVLIFLAVACSSGLAWSQQLSEGRSNSVALEQSFDTIHGTIAFNDNGSTLTVDGHATGMTPGLTYVSFIYGPTSFARGTLACIPPTPNKLNATQMFLGYWLPVNSPVRTLQASKTGGSYAPLSSFATASIRYDSNPNAAIGTPTPARFWLQTCGRVLPNDGEDFLATVTVPGDNGN